MAKCSFEVSEFELQSCPAQLAGAVEYTDCISAEEYPIPRMSILDMTLNHLMVRLQ